MAELFEARSPERQGMLAEMTGTVSFGRDQQGSPADHRSHMRDDLIPKE
jgi:hypothetical protein